MNSSLVEKKQSGDSGSSEGGLKLPNFKALFEKIRQIKHIKIIAVALLLGITLIIIAAVFVPRDEPNAQVGGDPLREFELRLENTLRHISGAGSVAVMITFEGGMEQHLAYTTNRTTNTTTDNSGGANRVTETVTESSTPLLVQNRPVVIKETMPPIIGVVILSQGAANIAVRMEILRATTRLLGIDAGKIDIFVKA